mgnify:FL=1
MNTIKIKFLFSVYAIINLLFIVKYGSRQEIIPTSLLLILYLLIVSGVLFICLKYRENINNFKKFNFYFFGFSVLILTLLILINILVEKNSLNVDRWSAMEVTIHSIINGIYPYNLPDHLGKTSSNLPSLSYLGLPFYLIGDVGFLQPFVFFILLIFLYKSKILPYQKLILSVLFLFSVAFMWEIYVKSDLMSNLIIVILFMLIWHDLFKDNYFKKPLLLAFIISFIILTRGIVIIPLTIFLFSKYIKSNTKEKIIFSIGVILFLMILSLPILISIPDIETLIEHNPFNHQTRYSSKFLQVIFILVPFIISFYMKNMLQIIYYSFLLIFILMFLTMFMNIFKNGFNESIFYSAFDLSYLGMIIPFSIFAFTLQLEPNEKRI